MLHPNVVIVRNVDPNGCARTRKCNYIKVSEVRFWKSVFLEVWGPRQLFNQTFGLIYQCVEFSACFFINDWDESFELCSCSGGIEISFDEADVCFNNGTNVFNPVALRVFMLIHISKLEVFDVALDHLILIFVGNRHKSILHMWNNVFHEAAEVCGGHFNSHSLVLVRT